MLCPHLALHPRILGQELKKLADRGYARQGDRLKLKGLRLPSVTMGWSSLPFAAYLNWHAWRHFTRCEVGAKNEETCTQAGSAQKHPA
jgi:hypothetical protein